MMVENFSEERIITSDLVKGFYSSLKNGNEFQPPTWADALENIQHIAQIQSMMAMRYKSERCRRCSSTCIVFNVKKQGPTHGRWVVQCKFSADRFRSSDGQQTENGHMFQFVPAPPMT